LIRAFPIWRLQGSLSVNETRSKSGRRFATSKNWQSCCKLYLWETGEVDPMWIDDEALDAITEPLPGESFKWANWKLDESSEPKN